MSQTTKGKKRLPPIKVIIKIVLITKCNTKEQFKKYGSGIFTVKNLV